MRLKGLTLGITHIHLLTAIFLVLLVGTVFGSYIYLEGVTNGNVRSALLEQQTQRQIDQTKSLSQHISSDIEIIVTRLELVAGQPALQRGELAGAEATELLKQAHEELHRTTLVDSVTIVDARGVNVNTDRDDYRKFMGADRSGLEAVQQVTKTRQPYVGSGFTGLPGIYYVPIAVPILNHTSGEYLGLVVTGFPTPHGVFQVVRERA